MPKKILLLYGSRVSEAAQLRILRNYSQKPACELEIMTIDDFAKSLNPKHESYDQIIIDAHGTYIGDMGRIEESRDRQKHFLEMFNQDTIPTAGLVRACSQFSKKIILSSCNAGVVMSDLYGESALPGVEIVVLGGSKHKLIVNHSLFNVEQKFLECPVKDLIEYCVDIFPDTVCFKSREGVFSKISAVTNSEESYDVIRNHSQLKENEDGNIVWVRKRKIELKPEELSQDFKDAAVTTFSGRKNQKRAQYWQEVGGFSEGNAIYFLISEEFRKIFGDDIIFPSEALSLFILVVHDQKELLEKFLEIKGHDLNPKPNSYFNPLLAAADMKKVEMIDLLLSKLSDEQVQQSCYGLKEISAKISDKFSQDNFRCLDVVEFLAPKIAKQGNRKAFMQLFDFMRENVADVDVIKSCLEIVAQNQNHEIAGYIFSELSLFEINHIIRPLFTKSPKAAPFLVQNAITEIRNKDCSQDDLDYFFQITEKFKCHNLEDESLEEQKKMGENDEREGLKAKEVRKFSEDNLGQDNQR